MLTYAGNNMVECYWEAQCMAEAIRRQLPPELLAVPPVWPERFKYNLQLDPNGELELVTLSLKENQP